MIISYKWLLDYLPQYLALDELTTILTNIGLEVEAVEKEEFIKGGLEGLVIGQVLTWARHPNADKLSVTTVDIGTETPLNIVCGAPNVAAGQKVVVAPVGCTVFPSSGEAFEIKKAKIRGEQSEGMICAEDEIGLGASHSGIMTLPETAPLGTLAKDYFKIPEADHAIHIGLTPNRSDAASHIGVARDVSAYLSHHSGKIQSVQLPEIPLNTSVKTADFSISIEDADACPRYMGLQLQGIQVGPSPDWLRQRLATIGLRSINNIVDATNYVLHEFGQPLHAFDADKIAGKTISVRYAKDKERFITLDGKERTLQSSDLMICDADHPIAMAGVFGGLESGVGETTKNIFLESAYFDPTVIRRTSLYHGLRTDAATHFEKGVDSAQVQPALLRAAAMIVELAGGSIVGPVLDEQVRLLHPVEFRIRYDFINRLSGKDYEPLVVQHLLSALGFKVNAEDKDELLLEVPSFLYDVHVPADVVEEIIRIDGLDKITIPQEIRYSLLNKPNTERKKREKIAQSLCGMGYSEIITNSITNSKYYPEQKDMVHMLNSLSSELDVLRPSMLESGLEVIAYNLARRNKDLCLFEQGSTYRIEEGQYKQDAKLILLCTGNARHASTSVKAVPANAAYLKSVVDRLLALSGIGKTIDEFSDATISVKWKNKLLCSIQEVGAQKLSDFDIKERVWVAEINWELFSEAMSQSTLRYTEVPKYPMVQRDLALVVDKEVTYAQLKRTTDKLKLTALKSYTLFDIFEHEKLGANKKSMAMSYYFQLNDRTLTDTETEQMMLQLIAAYTKDLDAQIRN